MTKLTAIETYYRTLRSTHARLSPAYFSLPTVEQTRRWVKLCRRGLHLGKSYTIAAH